MFIKTIESNMDNNILRPLPIERYKNKEKTFIITDKSDSNFEEDFEDNEYYDMYVKNTDYNIMEIAEILIIFPEHLYSIIRGFSDSAGINKKEIRGYSEYNEYVKNHNTICREIYFYKNEELRLESEIENLIRQKQTAKEEKIKKKKEYNLFMAEKMGTTDW